MISLTRPARRYALICLYSLDHNYRPLCPSCPRLRSSKRYSPSACKSQRSPPANQAQSAQRCHGAQELEPLRIQYQQVYASTEHSHSGCEERCGNCTLWSDDGSEEKDARVDELLTGREHQHLRSRTATSSRR